MDAETCDQEKNIDKRRNSEWGLTGCIPFGGSQQAETLCKWNLNENDGKLWSTDDSGLGGGGEGGMRKWLTLRGQI